MTAVKRYDLEQPDSHMGSASMKEEPQIGDWVRYEDYEALAALLAELFEAADWGYGTEQITKEEAEAWWPIHAKVKAFLDAQKPKQEGETK
jgi:hypothetical protein